MSVTGIGSVYTYVYNYETKKLSTTDGSYDAFVNFFNGTATEEDLKQLNGWDYAMRGDIWTLWEEFGEEYRENGMIPNDVNEYEITIDFDSIEEVKYYIGGRQVLGSLSSMIYTKEEIRQFSDFTQPYRTQQAKGYDPIDNSINIAVGNVYNLGNGYRITVLDRQMRGDGFGKGSRQYDDKMNQLIDGLNCLMRAADQITFASTIPDSYTPILLAFLSSLGVDTNREFIINGTHFEVRDGRIREVGNVSGVPNSYYQNAVKRYEEFMARSLYDYNKEQDLFGEKEERQYGN